MLGLTYCISLLGEARSFQILDEMASGWHYAGAFFTLGRLFFALGWFLSASCTFLAHVGRFSRAWGRSGLDFGWSGQGFKAFKTTFVDDFWRQQERITGMLPMQQDHRFCDVF